MGNFIKKLLVLEILGVAFLSGSARSLKIKAAHADPVEDDTFGGIQQSGASCD
jgi:hypothetical protein